MWMSKNYFIYNILRTICLALRWTWSKLYPVDFFLFISFFWSKGSCVLGAWSDLSVVLSHVSSKTRLPISSILESNDIVMIFGETINLHFTNFHSGVFFFFAFFAGKSGSRSRCTYTRTQIQELEKEFMVSHYVSSHRRLILASKLNLTDRQIKVWFQNRRSKEKRNSYSSEYPEHISSMTDNQSNDEHEQRIYEKALSAVQKEDPDGHDGQNLAEHPLKKIMKLMPHYYSD